MRISAVFTGGTISCSVNGGVLSPDGNNSFLLLKSRTDVRFETCVPYTILSENLTAHELELLYKTVLQLQDGGFDGIIIAHGTDTLQFTAAYLAEKLGLCETPVVLVSANFPLSDSRSNGYDNFSAAVDLIASKKGRGVFVTYRNRGDDFTAVHRGGELLSHAAYSDSLQSLDGNVFGLIADGGFVPNGRYAEHCNENGSAGRLSGRVLWLRAHPGMVYPHVDGAKAVLLEGYHSGTLNTDSRELKSFCEAAFEKNVPVYLTGSEEGFNYESKLKFDELKIKVLPKMPPVTAYIKLWLK